MGFAAGIMPGPLQSYLLVNALGGGLRRAAFVLPAPLLSDGPIVVVCVAVLGQLGGAWLRGLAFAGGAFLLWLAWTTWRGLAELEAPPTRGDAPARGSGWRVLGRAALVNALGPGPWVFWGTVMGPLVVAHWREEAGHALVFVGGFYGTFLATMAAQAILFTSARRLGERFVRVGVRLGVALLVVFAALLWASALRPRETSPSAPASKTRVEWMVSGTTGVTR